MNAAAIVESSLAVRLIRNARAVARVLGPSRHFSGRLRALGADVQQPVTTDDGDAISVVLDNSSAAKAALSGLVHADHMARRSAAGAALETFRHHARQLAVRDRVRLIALMLSTSIVIHGVLTKFGAPVSSWILSVVGLIALVATTACARSIEAAWIDWSARQAAPRHNRSM